MNHHSMLRTARLIIVGSAIVLGHVALGQFVEPVTVIHDLSRGPSFGWAVAELVDIDGDQVQDIISSSPLGSSNEVAVLSGASGALLHSFTSNGGGLGWGIADAGDVNADGTHDIVAGANTSGPGGQAFVYSGADGSVLWTFDAEAAGDQFGYGVGGAGDVNQDGHADILVGAPNNDASGSDSGRAYIFSGSDGTLIRTLEAESANDWFGRGTAGTRDLNGDGIRDQIVGAPRAAGGKAYVFSGADGSLLFDTTSPAGGSTYGEFFVGGLGDVDKDGTPDVYVGDYAAVGGSGAGYVYSGVDGSVLHHFMGTLGAGVGPGRGAGDVNGDGHYDIIIGHWTSSAGAAGGGRVQVYSGKDGTVLGVMTGTTPSANVGFDAVGLGDVNADGRLDYLIGASSAGRVFVVAGDIDPPAPVHIGTNRALAFAPSASTESQAIRVQLWSLYDEECPRRPHPLSVLSEHNYATRWLGPPTALAEDTSPPGPDFLVSQLQCCPHFRDWSAGALAAEFPGADVARIYGAGAEAVPCSAYDLQFVDTSCADLSDPSCFSDPIRVRTAKWGDTWAPFGNINFTDISKVVDRFKAIPFVPGPPEMGAAPKIRAMLRGNAAPFGTGVNFDDIGLAVSAFKTIAFAEAGPSICTEICP